MIPGPDPLITFWVEGIPATQGSKTPGRGGFGFHEADKKLPAWRKQLAATAKSFAELHDGAPYDFPLLARLDVYLPAPKKSKFGKWPAGKPDLDKLQRAVGDGITAGGLIKDDSRIVKWRAEKHWAEEGSTPGARISLWDLRDQFYKPLEQEQVLEQLPRITAEAREFSINQASGPDLLKLRGAVPMPGGGLQEVELTVGGQLAGHLRDKMMGSVSIGNWDGESIRAALATGVLGPETTSPPEYLTPEAYEQMGIAKRLLAHRDAKEAGK